MSSMRNILEYRVEENRAALWPLGQAGYVIRSCGVTLAIDPYLSDSVGKISPDFARAVPVPMEPGELRADVLIVTHDHTDHLDPETIAAYGFVEETVFVAPRLAARKLAELGVPAGRIRRVDSGETAGVRGVEISGVYAVPTGPDCIDTAGYRLCFENGRSLYHTSDTGYSDVLISAAPHAEVLLVCINGKFGNLNAAQAARLAAAVKPKTAIPNHYDVMALNSENPETFAFMMKRSDASIEVRILDILEPFAW